MTVAPATASFRAIALPIPAKRGEQASPAQWQLWARWIPGAWARRHRTVQPPGQRSAGQHCANASASGPTCSPALAPVTRASFPDRPNRSASAAPLRTRGRAEKQRQRVAACATLAASPCWDVRLPRTAWLDRTHGEGAEAAIAWAQPRGLECVAGGACVALAEPRTRSPSEAAAESPPQRAGVSKGLLPQASDVRHAQCPSVALFMHPIRRPRPSEPRQAGARPWQRRQMVAMMVLHRGRTCRALAHGLRPLPQLQVPFAPRRAARPGPGCSNFHLVPPRLNLAARSVAGMRACAVDAPCHEARSAFRSSLKSPRRRVARSSAIAPAPSSSLPPLSRPGQRPESETAGFR